MYTHMKISELILKLEEIKKEYGDIDVRYSDYEHGPESIDVVEHQAADRFYEEHILIS